jgi:hypothetical protein
MVLRRHPRTALYRISTGNFSPGDGWSGHHLPPDCIKSTGDPPTTSEAVFDNGIHPSKLLKPTNRG